MVFEDDARPAADAMIRLRRELECLQAEGIDWDAELYIWALLTS